MICKECKKEFIDILLEMRAILTKTEETFREKYDEIEEETEDLIKHDKKMHDANIRFILDKLDNLTK